MTSVLEDDVTYLFNTNRHHPYEHQKAICTSTLNFLNSINAAEQYSPADLVYMRSVWKKVINLVESKYGPNS